MKVEKYHYSNFLISVQFSRNFTPNTLYGKEELCNDFLIDLGNLARKNGMRLHATYSVCSGINDHHAHFGVSWLPSYRNKRKTSKRSYKRINRHPVIEILEAHSFYVDNPTQAIKVVTHDKPFVTSYILEQPKEGQTAILTGFYVHPDFVPVYTELKAQSYCRREQLSLCQNMPQNHRYNRLSLLFLISAAWFVLISAILLSVF